MNPIDTYINEAPPEHQPALSKLRDILRDTLIPLGFQEHISYGMMGYVVPFSLYPSGYHSDKELPLPFICLGSKKSGIHLYHMGVGADPNILEWWKSEYAKQNIGKLDMGVGCIRLRKIDKIPYILIEELAKKISAKDWIILYEQRYRSKK